MTLVTEPQFFMERKQALRRVIFLKALSDTAITAFASAGEEWTLAKGELLFAEHERCLGLMVVLSGAVKVYKTDKRGRELTIGRENPGGSVVELPLFDGGNYPASAEALEENTVVYLVRRERFLTLLGDYPEIAEHALRALAIRMRRLLEMVEAQTLHTVRARLATYLLQIATGRSEFVLTETNEAIASHLGTVREVVSRTLRSLKDGGLIALRGRTVTLLDAQALQQLSGSLEVS